MNFSNEVIVFLLVVLPIIFLFVVNKISNSKNNNKVRFYKDKITSLKANIKQLQDNKTLKIKETSYKESEHKKQEELQAIIIKQKKKIENLSAMAQEAMNTKYDFLSNMRHEVRTPLNSILVFSELLKDALSDDKLIDYVKNITISGNNLLVFVDKIIELGDVESGHFKRKDSLVNIDKFMNILTDKYKSRANEKGLLFTVDVDKNIPKTLILDEDKVSDILINILDNALKFTKYGSIKLELKLKNIDKLKNIVNISFMIKDSGKGIDERHQKTIFNVFEKKESGAINEYQSIGLGLSINKKVAQQLDGDIILVSTLDKGSIFSLYLNNVEIPQANKTYDIDENSIDFSLIKSNGGTIAIIDSESKNLKQVKNCFEHTSVEVLDFIDTREALKVLKNKDIDLLYIDSEILIMDDGAVSKVIKNLVKAPIIALTQGDLKKINYKKYAVVPLISIKKPITKFDLFSSSLMILDYKYSVIKNSKVLIDDNGLSDKIDFKNLGKFLTLKEIKLNPLYSIAKSSDDIDAKRVFASTLLELSNVYGIKNLYNYATLLLHKIDLLDLELINYLMKGYEVKIEELENIR